MAYPREYSYHSYFTLFRNLNWKNGVAFYDALKLDSKWSYEVLVSIYQQDGYNMIGDPEKHGYDSKSSKNEYLNSMISFFDQIIESRVRIFNFADT